jgi:conjugal transfer/type IV secretion protein DotA/TraY
MMKANAARLETLRRSKALFTYFFIFLLCWLLPDLALASGGIGGPAGDAATNITFTPVPGDISVKYLGAIFGQVGSILPSAGSGLFGVMFKAFNHGVLMLGGLMAAYTIIVGTLHTAHEGEFLGKKWSSTMVPVRGVMGVSFLLPLPSGYSLLQVGVMWIILQGVGLADSLWSQVIDAIATQGLSLSVNSCDLVPGSCSGQSSAQLITPEAMSGANTTVLNLLQSATCMQAVNRYAGSPGRRTSNIGAPTPTRTSSVVQKTGKTVYSYSLSFVGQAENNSVNCGTYSWTGEEGEGYGQTLFDTLPAVLSSVNQFAYTYVNASGPTAGDRLLQVVPTLASGLSTPSPVLQGLLAQFIGPIKNRANELANKETRKGQVQANLLGMKVPGWVLAGSFYLYLAELANAQAKLEGSATTTIPGSPPSNITGVLNAKEINQDIGQLTSLNATFTSSGNQITGGGFDPSQVPPGTGATKGGAFVSKLMTKIVGGVINNFPPKGNQNPLIALMVMGSKILSVVGASIVFMYSAGLAIVSAISVTVLGTGDPGLGAMLLMMVLPVAFFILGILAMLGSMITVYLPLMPYIYFLMGVIMWFMACIETIVAAPIVALGVMYPEAEGLVGRGSPSIMIIVNVFLRPSLMLIGLLASLLFSYVVLDLLRLTFFIPAAIIAGGSWFGSGPNLLAAYAQTGAQTSSAAAGFGAHPSWQGVGQMLAPGAQATGQALQAIGTQTLGFFGMLIEALFMIVIYVMLVIFLLNKCFSLVFILPDKVLRFVGGGGEFEAGKMAEEGGAEVKGVAEKGGGAMQAGATEMGGGLKKKGDEAVKSGKEQRAAVGQAGALAKSGGGEQSGVTNHTGPDSPGPSK